VPYDAVLRLHRALAEVQPASVWRFLALAEQRIRRELLDPVQWCYNDLGNNHATAALGRATR
jgi:hypothetical protein